MNTIPVNNEEQFDRLVDGELNESERRALLLALEQQPDGWRRCALAFLEAQEWRGALGSLAKPSAPAPAAVPAEARPQPAKSPASRWPLTPLGTLLAMAACCLIAAAITLEVRDRFGNQVALPDNAMMAQANKKLPENSQALKGLAPDGPWQMVTLSVPENGTGEAANIRLPCREGDNVDMERLRNLPTALSPEVRQALERSGYQVRQVRQLVPVPLGDGRRLVVPIDQVEVRYVGDKAY